MSSALRSYGAFLLLSLFSVTLMPFNALHEHHSDIHALALVKHDDSHQCELDERFCQDSFNHTCKHETHLSSPEPKCFSCHFHFLPVFADVQEINLSSIAVSNIVYISLENDLKIVTPSSPDNKGPPLVS